MVNLFALFGGFVSNGANHLNITPWGDIENWFNTLGDQQHLNETHIGIRSVLCIFCFISDKQKIGHLMIIIFLLSVSVWSNYRYFNAVNKIKVWVHGKKKEFFYSPSLWIVQFPVFIIFFFFGWKTSIFLMAQFKDKIAISFITVRERLAIYFLKIYSL